MKWEHAIDAEMLGADRVIAPDRSLPQPALRLDASGPVRSGELEIAVERLCLDSTSHRNIRERADDDGRRMGERILEIVGERGKMHNPETDSGGVLLGTVVGIGAGFVDPPAIGAKLVTLASLTLTPLRLTAIVHLDPASAQVEVEGAAYVSSSAPWGLLPADLSLATALELYDVYGAGSHTRELAPRRGTVCVLGTGHAGKLALAAARESMEEGTLIAVDIDSESLERVHAHGLCDIAVTADLRDPLAAASAVRDAGAPPADLTVVVVNAPGCESTAIMLTADGGRVLFYSMATSFQTAALSADGMSRDVEMLIGNGFAPDTGAYALDLARRSPELRRAIGAEMQEAA